MSDFSYTIRSENHTDIGPIFALTEAAFRDAPFDAQGNIES